MTLFGRRESVGVLIIDEIDRGIEAHDANSGEATAIIATHTGLKPELLKEIVPPDLEPKRAGA